MPAIKVTPRVNSFQAGGAVPDDQPGSMLFPGMMPPQPDQQPAIQTAPPMPAPQQPAPQPAQPQAPSEPMGEQSYDDNIELDKARREDEALLDPNNVLGRYGDRRYATAPPQLQDYRTDPEYATVQQAQEYIQQNGAGQKPADINRAISMLRAKEAALKKRYADEYKTNFNTWKLNEVQQLKGAEGDKLTGRALEDNWASAENARSTIDKGLATNGPNAALERAGSATSTMKPNAFNEAVVRIGQLNNLPPERASEILMHIAAPNGQFNGRKGIAAANYKILGLDATDHVWIATEDGKFRVPSATLDQINAARFKAYRDVQALEKKQKSTPPSRTIGQWITGQQPTQPAR